MKADPEGSLEYFASGATEGSEVDPLAGGPHVVTAKDGKHLKELLGKKGNVVLDFVAGWCGKCKQIMPFVNELSETHAGKVTFVKVDTTEDALAEAVAEHGVSVLPAFHFFKDGQPFGAPIMGYKKTPLKDAVAALAKK
jgi:thiol-disulfide isomerase/thioredoxin